MYRGTFDAFHKILKYEGVKGLYRGFWISCFQVRSLIFLEKKKTVFFFVIFCRQHLEKKVVGFNLIFCGDTQVVSGLCYVSTYEGVRHVLDNHGIKENKVKAMLGGASASLVGQTIIVPFDVISQHLMVLGTIASKGKTGGGGELAVNPLAVPTEGRSKAQVAWDVTRQ